MSCAQIKVTGGGTGSPSMVSIPGYIQANSESALGLSYVVFTIVFLETLVSLSTFMTTLPHTRCVIPDVADFNAIS